MQEPKIKISVIIPVYNVEPWIGECIESLKCQRQDGLEFIFVDDRSTDNSMRLVEEWAAEDERVRILRNKENSGPGPSRNVGIEAARGDYLSFIDPDDLVSDDFYELLYSKAKETDCDIVKGVRISFKDGEHAKKKGGMHVTSIVNKRIEERGREEKPLFLCFTYEHQTAIFKRTLFADKSVRYGSSRNAEDIVFLLKICLKTESIATMSEPAYYYRSRESVATSEYSLRRANNELASFKEQIDYIMHGGAGIDENTYLYCLKNYRSYTSALCHAEKAEHISSREIKEYIAELKECISDMAPLLHTYGSVPEIEAVTENDCLLATVFCDDKEVTAEEISDWISYYLRKDIGQGEVIKRKISRLIDSYIKKFSGSGEKEYDLAIRDILKGFKMRDRIELAFKTGYYSSRRHLRRLKRSIKSLGPQSVIREAAENTSSTNNIIKNKDGDENDGV